MASSSFQDKNLKLLFRTILKYLFRGIDCINYILFFCRKLRLMKKFSSNFILIILVIQHYHTQINDSVYLLPSYVNQSFYNLDNGEIANENNNNWDLAFSAAGGGASIRINGQSGVVLYNYPNGDTSAWTSLDTNGINNWSSVYNSDNSWDNGAFNINASSSNSLDLGWGIYSTITHHVTGDSLNVIKLSNGAYKKLQILKLSSGNYDFRYANIDGSNEVITSISKSNYAGKNFGYYSLINGTEIDREPLSSDWHLVFTKYITTLLPSGLNYGVTGVLSNKNMQIAKAENVDVSTADHNSHTYSSEINAIGYNWKSFNMATFSYDIQDSLCYFIKDDLDNVWKLQLTGFDGSSTGGIFFNVEKIISSHINENKDITFHIYPNPSTNGFLTIMNDLNQVYENSSIKIFDANGRLVIDKKIVHSGFTVKNINIDELDSGIYIVSLINGDEIIKKKLIIQ